jgi:iron-sulfur cluster insertion protein
MLCLLKETGYVMNIAYLNPLKRARSMLGQLYVTDKAAAQINKIIAQKGEPDLKFRVMVLGGGCSGFKYQFDFDKTQNDWDLVFTKDNATVLVDDLSIQFVKEAELDFEKDLTGSRFVIRNPNAASGCGCGVSFSMKAD